MLALPADADLQGVDRQTKRIRVIVANGMELPGFLPMTKLSLEDLLQAVYRIDRPEERFVEELFWVHEMDGLMDQPLAWVLERLRAGAVGARTCNAVARHNLAVLQTICGREGKADVSFLCWMEALEYWKYVIEEELFWVFMEGRAYKGGWHPPPEPEVVRAFVRRQVSRSFCGHFTEALTARNLANVAAFSRIAIRHRSWLDTRALLDSVAKQILKEGFSALGTALDQVVAARKQENRSELLRLLELQEVELGRVADEYGAIVRSLAELADPCAWDDSVALSYRTISDAYFEQADKPHQAARLNERARALAHDPHLSQRLLEDRKRIDWTLLSREARASLRAGNLGTAESRLASALPLSTDEQKKEIQTLLAQCHWARVLSGIDINAKEPYLSTISGIGARFHGKRNHDPLTKTYVTNHWLTILFLPVFPLGAYRVTRAGSGSWYIHGQAPLSGFLRKLRWSIAAVTVAVFLILLVVGSTRGKNATPASNAPPSSVVSQAS